MKFFATSIILSFIHIATADNFPRAIDPTNIAPHGCPSPTPWYNCATAQGKTICSTTDLKCECSSASVQLNCLKSYCPNVSRPSHGNNCNGVDSPTKTPAGPAASQASAALDATTTPKAPATTQATATTASPGESSSAQPTGGATGTSSSPSASTSASASGKPNGGSRSMTVSSGLWAAAAAAVAFGAIMYRL